MGRKPISGKARTSTERSRLSRQRAKLKLVKAQANIREDKVWEPVRSAKQWASRNEMAWVEDQAVEAGISHLFLFKKKDSSNKFLVRLSHITDVKTPKFVSDLLSETEARTIFRDFLNKTLDPSYYGLDHYSKKAEEVLLLFKNGDKNALKNTVFPNRYGFVFALFLKDRLGFDGYEGTSPAGTTSNNQDKAFAHIIHGFLKNKQIPNSNNGVIEDTKGVINELIQAKRITSTASVPKYLRIINDSFHLAYKIAGDHSEAYKHFSGLRYDLLTDVYKTLEVKKKKGEISDGENHPYIPLDKLTAILDHAFETSRSLYNQIVLELTTICRPGEGYRLSIFGEKYFNEESGTLAYNHEGVPKGTPVLIKKADENSLVDIKDLINPTVSIVGRYILKHTKHEIKPEFYFKAGYGYRKSNSDLEPYYHRCLRTTGATMLAYCGKAKHGTASFYDVQLRMAHQDPTMATKVYAKSPPSSMSVPENYFKIVTLKLEDGFDLGEGSNLWDMWLLRDFVKRYKKAYRDEGRIAEYKNKFLPKLKAEVKAFKELNIIREDDKFNSTI